ncbi:unnamed protein product, partial [Prorocentrum cordatum]
GAPAGGAGAAAGENHRTCGRASRAPGGEKGPLRVPLRRARRGAPRPRSAASPPSRPGTRRYCTGATGSRGASAARRVGPGSYANGPAPPLSAREAAASAAFVLPSSFNPNRLYERTPPGPSDYEPGRAAPVRARPSQNFQGKAERFFHLESVADDAPGPGAYSPRRPPEGRPAAERQLLLQHRQAAGKGPPYGKGDVGYSPAPAQGGGAQSFHLNVNSAWVS